MDFSQDDLTDAFRQAVGESLEGMAFLEYDEADVLENLPDFSEKHHYSDIDFTVPLQAKFILLGKYEFIKETVESINGEEISGDTQILISDTLGEIVNTIGGRFLANITPADEEFEMGLPSFGEVENKDQLPDYSDQSIVISFKFMEDELIAILSL